MEALSALLARNPYAFIGEETAFRSAVLLPLVRVEEEWHILFEVRSSKLNKQPGDISFPGGRIDKEDASPLAAAVRETAEELRIDKGQIHVVGALPPLVNSPSLVMYPFVGVVDYDPASRSFNEEEVAEVFTVPLPWLRSCEPYKHTVPVKPTPKEDFPFEKIVNGREYQWRTRSMEQWFYDYREHTIWGLTARVLKHFLDLIKDSNDIF